MPRYEFRTAEQEVAENAARVDPGKRHAILRAAMKPMAVAERSDVLADALNEARAAGFVNYLPPKAGSMVYDSNWLANNTTRG